MGRRLDLSKSQHSEMEGLLSSKFHLSELIHITVWVCGGAWGYMWAYVCWCACSCVYLEAMEEPENLPYLPVPYCFQTWSLTEPGARLASPRDPPVSVSLNAGVKTVHTATQILYMNARGLNSGPHAYAAVALTH